MVKKFCEYWEIIKNAQSEDELFHTSKLGNFSRDHFYESDALKLIKEENQCQIKPCGCLSFTSFR